MVDGTDIGFGSMAKRLLQDGFSEKIYYTNVESFALNYTKHIG